LRSETRAGYASLMLERIRTIVVVSLVTCALAVLTLGTGMVFINSDLWADLRADGYCPWKICDDLESLRLDDPYNLVDDHGRRHFVRGDLR